MSIPKLQEFTTLTFDVVGTLIDFEQGIIDWFQGWLAGQSVVKSDEDILKTFAVCEDQYQKRTPYKPFTAMLPLICMDMATAWQTKLDQKAAADFQQSISRWPAFADSKAALLELKKRYRLAAVTNADSWALSSMSATLGNPFDLSVTCDEVRVNKPSHRVFSFVLEKLSQYGVSKEQILHIAQSQYHDIVPASEMGFATMWIERRSGRPGFGATPEPKKIAQPTFHCRSMAGCVRTLTVPTAGSGS